MVRSRFRLTTALALSAAVGTLEASRYLDVGGVPPDAALWPLPPAIAMLVLARSPLIGAKVGLLGVFLNVLVMGANEGSMPVVYETDRCSVEACEESWLSPAAHVPGKDARLSLLADRLAVPYTAGNAIVSAGDIVLASGLLWMVAATALCQDTGPPSKGRQS